MFKFMLHYLLKKFVSKSAIVVVALLSGVPVTFPSQNGYKTIKVLLFGESVFHEVWVTVPLPETTKDTRVDMNSNGDWVRWKKCPDLSVGEILAIAGSLSDSDIVHLLKQI